MDKTDSEVIGEKRRFAAAEMSDSTERLVRAFAHTLSIGFAVLDHELRYQAINSQLICRICRSSLRSHTDEQE